MLRTRVQTQSLSGVATEGAPSWAPSAAEVEGALSRGGSMVDKRRKANASEPGYARGAHPGFTNLTKT